MKMKSSVGPGPCLTDTLGFRGALTENIKKVAAQALIKAEELSKKVPLGDKTLADVVFNTKERVRIVAEY